MRYAYIPPGAICEYDEKESNDFVYFFTHRPKDAKAILIWVAIFSFTLFGILIAVNYRARKKEIEDFKYKAKEH